MTTLKEAFDMYIDDEGKKELENMIKTHQENLVERKKHIDEIKAIYDKIPENPYGQTIEIPVPRCVYVSDFLGQYLDCKIHTVRGKNLLKMTFGQYGSYWI